jgi:hypothetical protein
MKNLNNTNLLGANGNYRVRINFSYKTKIGDKLQPNLNGFKTNESESRKIDRFNNFYTKNNADKIEEYNIKNNKSFENSTEHITSSKIKFKRDNKIFNKSYSKEKKTNVSSVVINDFESKSTNKMQIDDGNFNDNDNPNYLNSGENKFINYSCYNLRENKNYNSYQNNKEEKYEREYDDQKGKFFCG